MARRLHHTRCLWVRSLCGCVWVKDVKHPTKIHEMRDDLRHGKGHSSTHEPGCRICLKWDEFADGKGGEYLGRHPAFGLPTGAGIRRTCRKTFIRSSAIMKKAHTYTPHSDDIHDTPRLVC